MKPGKDYPGIGVFALILSPKNEVLLINHKSTEKRDKEYEMWWSMPGETVEGALKREIKEELGLNVFDQVLLNYNDYIKVDKHWLSINVLARTKSNRVKLNEPDKIVEYRWFSLDSPPENLSPYAKECWQIMLDKLNPPKPKAGTDYTGVGCGALIVNDKNETLLMHRTENSKNDRGKWNKPGGALEYNETFEEAVRREVREEVGVEIEITRILKYSDYVFKEDKQHWVSQSFVAHIVSGEPRNMEPHKHSEIRWFPLDHLPDNCSGTVTDPVAEYLEILKKEDSATSAQGRQNERC